MGKLVLYVILFLLIAPLPFLVRWAFKTEKRLEREREERRRQRTVLYEMTVDEAQAIVSSWERMTEEERAALPPERRAEIRKIREGLAAHKRKWRLD